MLSPRGAKFGSRCMRHGACAWTIKLSDSAFMSGGTTLVDRSWLRTGPPNVSAGSEIADARLAKLNIGKR